MALYRELGRPPSDPTLALVWAQRCMLSALFEVINDGVIDAEKRWKLISQLGSQIGVTHAKALIQDKLEKVTKKLEGKKDVTGGPKSLGAITKPATARRSGSGSGGNQVPGPLLSDDEAEDG